MNSDYDYIIYQTRPVSYAECCKIVDNFRKLAQEFDFIITSSPQRSSKMNVNVETMREAFLNLQKAYENYMVAWLSTDSKNKFQIVNTLSGDVLNIPHPRDYSPNNSDLILDDSEKNTALRGEKIEAIKALRGRTGCGLKEAKDAVEGFLAIPR